MNFELILVSLTLVAGVIAGIEALYRRVVKSDSESPPAQNVAVEYSRSFFPVLLFVVVVRSFLFEPFRIPSGSMIPTLVIGDFIVVSKFAYGVRLPVLHNKILELGEPERGDVMVFRFPADTRVNYIKRLVGLPGDTVEYRNRRLRINGELVPLELLQSGRAGVELALETLGDVRHEVRHETRLPSRGGTFVVPEGHYFMMGDNRDRSLDSRFAEVGFVPAENVVGKAVRIWMSWDFKNAPQWGRIGGEVR